MFCYNTKNSLTSDAIKKLSIMSVLSDKVKANKSCDTFYKAECPDFLWVVRDYALQITLSPIEKLEKFLEEESIKNVKDNKALNNINERNVIRKKLKTAFRTIDCEYLPCPVSDGTNNMTLEEALQNMDSIDWSQLREPFRKRMTELCNNIKERIRPKRINSAHVTGRVFAAYIKEIVKQLNLNETIYLTESFTASIKLAALETLEIVKSKYKDEMNKLDYPLDLDEFTKIEVNLSEECIKQLKETITGDEQILNKTLEKFVTFKTELKFQENNEKKVFDKAYGLAETIWKSNMEPKIHSFKYTYEFRNFMEKIKTDFEMNDFNSKNSKISLEAWKKWINSVNLTNVETTIEQRRISEEKIEALEAEKKLQRQKAEEHEKKINDLQRKNEELSNSQQTVASPIESWLNSTLNNTHLDDPDSYYLICDDKWGIVSNNRFHDASSVFSRGPRFNEARSMYSNNPRFDDAASVFSGRPRSDDTRSISSNSSSRSTGPRCKDGSLDMRYKINKDFKKYED